MLGYKFLSQSSQVESRAWIKKFLWEFKNLREKNFFKFIKFLLKKISLHKIYF